MIFKKYIWEIRTDNPSLTVKILNATSRPILETQRDRDKDRDRKRKRDRGSEKNAYSMILYKIIFSIIKKSVIRMNVSQTECL